MDEDWEQIIAHLDIPTRPERALRLAIIAVCGLVLLVVAYALLTGTA